jgi:flagellar motor switch protein FliM
MALYRNQRHFSIHPKIIPRQALEVTTVRSSDAAEAVSLGVVSRPQSVLDTMRKIRFHLKISFFHICIPLTSLEMTELKLTKIVVWSSDAAKAECWSVVSRPQSVLDTMRKIRFHLKISFFHICIPLTSLEMTELKLTKIAVWSSSMEGL